MAPGAAMRGRWLTVAVALGGVLVGFGPSPAWAAPGGALDPAFGVGGKVLTPFPGPATRSNGVAVQPDGKIVVAGSAVPTSFRDDIAVARYTPDGALDPSFGTGGRVLTDFGSGHTYDFGNAVAVVPDGRIVVAGATGSSLVGIDLVVVWYSPDGTRDAVGRASFGGTGRLSGAAAVAVQPDGKIVAAGWSAAPGGFNDFALARFTPDGRLDTAFGAGGTVLTDVSGTGADDAVRALALQPDGRIVVAGRATAPDGTGGFVLARYRSDGTLDAGFGTAGIVRTTQVGAARAVAVQPNGKIVAAGSAGTDFALVRYRSDGRLDRTFGASGIVLTGVDSPTGATAIVIQPNRKILAVGSGSTPSGTDFTLVRYRTDGTLDAGFGTAGVVRTDVAGASDNPTAVAIQRDRRVVVAGTSQGSDVPSQFSVVRYLP